MLQRTRRFQTLIQTSWESGQASDGTAALTVNWPYLSPLHLAYLSISLHESIHFLCSPHFSFTNHLFLHSNLFSCSSLFSSSCFHPGAWASSACFPDSPGHQSWCSSSPDPRKLMFTAGHCGQSWSTESVQLLSACGCSWDLLLSRWGRQMLHAFFPSLVSPAAITFIHAVPQI